MVVTRSMSAKSTGSDFSCEASRIARGKRVRSAEEETQENAGEFPNIQDFVCSKVKKISLSSSKVKAICAVPIAMKKASDFSARLKGEPSANLGEDLGRIRKMSSSEDAPLDSLLSEKAASSLLPQKDQRALDVPCFTDDLMMEILGRSPTKSLCRFKCVSKSWEGLITNLLSSWQRIRPLSSPLLVYYLYRGSFVHVPTSVETYMEKGWKFLLESNPTLCVDHSCNGLLLCRKNHDCHLRQYFIYNPTTMESVALPAAKVRKHCPLSCLAFDPHKSPHYKVVRFINTRRTRHSDFLELEMYSSLTGKWIHLKKNRAISNFYYASKFSVFHEGCFYETFPDGVARFDLGKLREFPLRYTDTRGETLDAFGCGDALGVSRGCLYLASPPRGSSGGYSKLRIWILEERYPYRWILKHTIETETFEQHPLTSDDMVNRSFRVLSFHPDAEVIYLGFRTKIVSCHFTTGRFEEVCRGVAATVTTPEGWSDGFRIPPCLWRDVYTIPPCLESLDPPGGAYIQR